MKLPIAYNRHRRSACDHWNWKFDCLLWLAQGVYQVHGISPSICEHAWPITGLFVSKAVGFTLEAYATSNKFTSGSSGQSLVSVERHVFACTVAVFVGTVAK